MQTVFALFREFLLVAIGSLAIWIGAEAVGAIGSAIGWKPVDFLFTRVVAGAYTDLLGTGVGALATLLGLYWATVGVVASTVYRAVPGEIRDLFIQERSGNVFVRGVVYALNLGLLELAAAAVGRLPFGLAILLFAALSGVAALRLVVLGGQLFNFFDLSQLGRPLPRRFQIAVKRAALRRQPGEAASQHASHREAYGVMKNYERLATVVSAGKLHTAAAPIRLARQLLRIVEVNSAWKASIPSASSWWSRTPKHANWFTLDHTRLQVSLATSTGPTPELVADFGWVEQSASRSLDDLLRSAIDAGGFAEVVSLSDSISETGRRLAGRFQVQEALVVIRGARRPNATHPSALDAGTRLNILAMAERSLLPLTNVWLGYVDSLEAIKQADLGEMFAAAITDPSTLYRSGLPRITQSLLESFGEQISRERWDEGKRITPQWWVNHHAARTIATQVSKSRDDLLAEIVKAPLDAISAFRADNQIEPAVVAALSALELIHKAQIHSSMTGQAMEKLSGYRKAETDNDRWPSPVFDDSQLQVALDQVVTILSELLPTIATKAHDDSVPDLFGQVHQVLTEAAFEAILDGRKATATTIFKMLLFHVDTARDRILTDLADQEVTTRVVYSVEPIISVMELSGYSVLMQEVDGDGIWDEIVRLWGILLAGDTDNHVPSLLIQNLTSLDHVYALTTGGMMRTSRVMQLRLTLEKRGFSPHPRWDPFDPEPASGSDPKIGPLLAVVLDEYGMHDDMADLFVSEYLIQVLPADVDLPTHTRSFLNAMKNERERRERTSNLSPSPGDAK